MRLIKINHQVLPNYLNTVARNHARILNHHHLINLKIAIGQQIGLIPGRYFSEELVSENLQLLDRAQNSLISNNELIDSLYGNVKRLGVSRSHYEKCINRLIHAGHMELHPTDICDHHCPGCYYSDKMNDVMEFSDISYLVDMYSPRSIVLVGGGEPALYNFQGKTLNDVIAEIKKVNPKIQIGVVTKGTNIPGGEWQKQVDWIRVSVDSATSKTFFQSKKKDDFDLVLRHFFQYLEGPISHVGLGFLFYRENIHETFMFSKLVFDEVNRKAPSLLHKVNIQYRPLRPVRDVPEKVRKNHVSADMLCSYEQILSQMQLFENEFSMKSSLADFILRHTNWEKISEGNGCREGKSFDKCYYSLIFRIFRPNGDVYPCFVRVSDQEYLLGNYKNASVFEHAKLNLLSFLFFHKQRAFCSQEHCVMSFINNVGESGMKKRSAFPKGETAKSFFF